MTLIKDFVFSGKTKALKIRDLEKSLPWKWDQVIGYLSILEQRQLITFSRTESRYKTCILNVNKPNPPLSFSCLFEYYTHFYTNENFTRENVKELINLILQYFQKRKKLEKIKEELKIKKIRPLSIKEEADFINDLVMEYNSPYLGTGEQIINIFKLLLKNPFLLKGIVKEEE
ncbi:MAG: hypothetical protein DRP02_07790 [Candidatus Gerdarchaeota archaeon]|nr:MAG: hypothetical protein DRO63_01005 [Candidatus Gerdarchaeota archaeon]RLI70470.1 MAG: hypothetical protein DRP02_07790 [Candidatus Gerdarchaeota archaeon]